MVNELKKSIAATILIAIILFATLSIGGVLNLFTPEDEALFFAWLTSSIGFGCSTFAVIVLAYKELHKDECTGKEKEICEFCNLKEKIAMANAMKDITVAKSEEEVEKTVK